MTTYWLIGGAVVMSVVIAGGYIVWDWHVAPKLERVAKRMMTGSDGS